MKNDIIPPSRPTLPTEDPAQQQDQLAPASSYPEQPESPVATEASGATLQSEQQPTLTSDPVPQPAKRFSTPIKWASIIFLIIVIGLLAGLTWYKFALRPVAEGTVQSVQVDIEPNSSPAQIASLLEEKKVIRSQLAFNIYVRVHEVRGQLLAGSYRLSPAESTAQIVAHLTKGQFEQFDVTFYPGATLNIASTENDKTPSHRQVLQKLGYGDAEIDDAFAASYADQYPLLFADKPATADLEGYIYGQTYKVVSGASVKQVLSRTFEEYEKQIKDNNLAKEFESQGLTMYEAIILASIVQREVPTAADQKQVAQIFLKRYREGGTLGSDVTYHYAADKNGVQRTHLLKDPYNTRIYPGLPPGPIASPGISALLAVAMPAEGDYQFFLSGDDDKTYFAHTQAEHEDNIVKHCMYKCSLP